MGRASRHVGKSRGLATPPVPEPAVAFPAVADIVPVTEPAATDTATPKKKDPRTTQQRYYSSVMNRFLMSPVRIRAAGLIIQHGPLSTEQLVEYGAARSPQELDAKLTVPWFSYTRGVGYHLTQAGEDAHHGKKRGGWMLSGKERMSIPVTEATGKGRVRIMERPRRR